VTSCDATALESAPHMVAPPLWPYIVRTAVGTVFPQQIFEWKSFRSKLASFRLPAERLASIGQKITASFGVAWSSEMIDFQPISRWWRKSRPASITPVRPADPSHDAAIVFVHGFSGSGVGTWKNLAPRIAAEPRLSSWDVWTVTYATSWWPDLSGVWSADADLPTLGQRLATDLGQGALSRYKSFVLVAHSMGGLIVQKALVDSQPIARKTRAVILFGTPSNGLDKARAAKIWKGQLDGMSKDGAFITTLRADWKTRFDANAPFSFLAVAGEKDQFVPCEASLAPFPQSQCAVVAGNHVTMISPPPDDPNVVDLITRRIAGGEGSADIGDSALRAIELGDFHRIIGDYLGDAGKLDRETLVRLAIALDAVGRRNEAYRVLAERNDLDSDALGTMAGRLKRNWLLSGRLQADAEAAMTHYRKGFELAEAKPDLRQAYYHGINLAFLALTFKGDPEDARGQAQRVLDICSECERLHQADEWLYATKGEAELILGNEEAAFDAYRQFVAAGNDPWKLSSTYLNARTIAAKLGRRDLARRLGQIFGDPHP
jgi:pimeloyl-ACP methyl ester carboxylesterase